MLVERMWRANQVAFEAVSPSVLLGLLLRVHLVIIFVRLAGDSACLLCHVIRPWECKQLMRIYQIFDAPALAHSRALALAFNSFRYAFCASSPDSSACLPVSFLCSSTLVSRGGTAVIFHQHLYIHGTQVTESCCIEQGRVMRLILNGVLANPCCHVDGVFQMRVLCQRFVLGNGTA